MDPSVSIEELVALVELSKRLVVSSNGAVSRVERMWLDSMEVRVGLMRDNMAQSIPVTLDAGEAEHDGTEAP